MASISPTAKQIIPFHTRLNPALWDKNANMRPEVRVRLLRASIAFYKFIDVPKLKISDIVLTGSNAAFNYSSCSDVDIHLVVDYEKSVCPDLAANFFDAKKNLWNLSHDIAIRGFPVEVYVEDLKQPAFSNGVFSILRGQWNISPKPKKPLWDDAAILMKTKVIVNDIEELIADRADIERLERLRKKIYIMRQSGLEEGGEFSVENLTFKNLRSLGYINKIRDYIISAKDKSLSLL